MDVGEDLNARGAMTYLLGGRNETQLARWMAEGRIKRAG
jgi:hypothetical protein